MSAVGLKIAARMEALRPKVGIAPIIRTFFVVILPGKTADGSVKGTLRSKVARRGDQALCDYLLC